MAKIYINPGHGGSDPGAVALGRQEKVDNLKYASQTASLLSNLGHAVKLERDGDYLISVTNIAKKANEWGADLFISFHRNSTPNATPGAETLICSAASNTSRKMAQAIQDGLTAVGFNNRGVKVQDKNTYVLQATHMPACTIEAGFLDNAGDNAIFDSKFDQICVNIANAISQIAGGAVTPGPVTPSGAIYDWQAGFEEYPVLDAPNDNANVITYLSPDDTVSLESYYTGDKYARILLMSGDTGYINFDYISKK